LYSKNLDNYTQSAGNLSCIISLLLIYLVVLYISTSTSETIRETSFNYDLYYKKYSKDIDSEWLTWFIGFAEGDGYLGVYNNRPSFTLTQKEGKILYDIKEKLKIGSISKDKNGNHRFRVGSLDDILKLAYIFNGNLVIEYRINQLSFWFSVFNQRGIPLKFNNKPVIPTLSDSWLCGFTDAEGCFNVTITIRRDTKIPSTRIRLRYILDQNNYLNNFLHIKGLFNSGYISPKPKHPHQFRFTIDGFKSIPRVIDYFTIYPLKTNKIISYNLWIKVFSMVLKKEHLTSSGITKIRQLTHRINIENSINKKTGHSLKKKMKI
jgi:hypothetical protein